MKKNLLFMAVLSIGIILSGCTSENDIIPQILSVNPTDGASNLSKSELIEVEFSEPMDEASCETRFALYEGDFSSMPMMGNDVSGHFEWNDDNTIMTFHPDSLFADSMMYTFFLEEGMMGRNGMGNGMMGRNGMMRSGMQNHGRESNSGIMVKFMTGSESPNSLSKIMPAHNDSNVMPNTDIGINFSDSMDVGSCESRFFLYEGELTEIPMMGGMGMGMNDDRVPGEFYWNSDSSFMTFQPDSMLHDSTYYSICLKNGMMSRNHDGDIDMDDFMGSGMSGSHGMMTNNGIISRFRTK